MHRRDPQTVGERLELTATERALQFVTVKAEAVAALTVKSRGCR
jgi:hypothetical protein